MRTRLLEDIDDGVINLRNKAKRNPAIAALICCVILLAIGCTIAGILWFDRKGKNTQLVLYIIIYFHLSSHN